MKRKITFIILLFISLNSYAVAKTLKVNIESSSSISSSYQKVFAQTLAYWIKSKTVYKLSSRSSNLLSISVRRRVDHYVLEASLEEKGLRKRQAFTTFYRLVDFFDAVDKLFYQKILYDKILEKKRTYLNKNLVPHTSDVAFLIDSTGSMKEEIEYFKQKRALILASIWKNLKTDHLRFAFMDYKNAGSSYRKKLSNFKAKTEHVYEHLESLQAVGKASGDLVYAFANYLRYGSWKGEKRFLFIITDSAPRFKGRFNLLLKKAKSMGIRVYFILADGTSQQDLFEYEAYAKTYQSAAVPISYFLNYVLKDYSLKSFVYFRQNIWEKKEDEPKLVDISLGRKVRNLSLADQFLSNEGIGIEKRREITLNIDMILDELLKPYKKTLPVARFKIGNAFIEVGIQDKGSLNYLKRLRGRRIVLGGQIYPINNSFSIVPHTLLIKRQAPPRPFLQESFKILKNPGFYSNKGIFEPSLWYFYAVFMGFKK